MNRKKLVGKGIKERGTFITRSEIDKIYTRGYRQGVKALAERANRYYASLPTKTIPTVVEYTIKILAEELLEEGE